MGNAVGNNEKAYTKNTTGLLSALWISNASTATVTCDHHRCGLGCGTVDCVFAAVCLRFIATTGLVLVVQPIHRHSHCTSTENDKMLLWLSGKACDLYVRQITRSCVRSAAEAFFACRKKQNGLISAPKTSRTRKGLHLRPFGSKPNALLLSYASEILLIFTVDQKYILSVSWHLLFITSHG